MFRAIVYVLKENICNIYRTYAIAKYEIKADVKDSKLGFFWNIASPAIQIATYWFVFGFIFQRNEVDGIDYLSWLLGGMIVWFFVSPCITKGCNAISSKTNVITKMPFPISTLPTTVIFKETFNHLCLLSVTLVLFICLGHYPNLYWFELIYYILCTMIFAISLSLTTSVLTMLARDVSKFVASIIKLLMYITPLFWNINSVSAKIRTVLKCNPIYYLVAGYRDCFFYNNGFLYYWKEGTVFWMWTFFFFIIGGSLMYRFKTRFIDLI